MKLMLVLLFLVSMTGVANDALAINLKPGNYEIKNWIELPEGGSSKVDRSIEYLDDPAKIKSKLAKESGCETVSEEADDNAWSFELNCKPNGIEKIVGNFTFTGDSFEARFVYSGNNGKFEMNVGMRGKRIGDNPSSTPQPTSKKELADIDKELRRIWSSMLASLKKEDFKNALEFFHPHERKKQAEIFEDLTGKWPAIVNDVVELRLDSIDNERGFAHYKVVTKDGNGRRSYSITFQKNQDDRWYILNL